MKRLVMLLAGVMLASPLMAQEDQAEPDAANEAVEILKKCDAACKEVKSARYDASYWGTGWLASRVPTLTGSVVIGGEFKDAITNLKLELTIKMPESEETKKYTAGADGELYYLIDHAAKTVYADIDPMVMGSNARALRGIMMVEYLHPKPFSDEIKAAVQEVKGTVKIGDEECYQIHVEYTVGGQEAIWYISKKDFLPRRCDRMRTNSEGEKGTSELIVTNLAVNPSFITDPFKLNVPEGYTQTDDFAP